MKVSRDESRRFVGRGADLAALRRHLTDVRSGTAVMLTVRGRRQVGKSRLINELVTTSGLPQLYVTGTRQASLAGDLESFRQDASLGATLPDAETLRAPFVTWEQALRAVHAIVPRDSPSIIVMDEFPWLLRNDPGLEGTLQKLWDRLFEASPVLFILVGSDLSVMELITGHDRPLYGRSRQLLVRPMSVVDVADLAGMDITTGAGAALAVDALLLTGGYPRLVARWRGTDSATEYASEQLQDEGSDFVTMGQRILDAEFPADLTASTVLRAVGAGERTFSGISSRAPVSAATLSRTLAALSRKRVIAVDEPVSSQAALKLARYRIEDSYLRTWLRLVEPTLTHIERGRSDLAITRFLRDWPTFRGRAVEPFVRESLVRRAASDATLGSADTVGGWWPRSNDPEVDLVGAVTTGGTRRVTFVGSIEWREDRSFGFSDLAELAVDRRYVPGAEAAPLLAVSRSGFSAHADIDFGPVDLVSAWR